MAKTTGGSRAGGGGGGSGGSLSGAKIPGPGSPRHPGLPAHHDAKGPSGGPRYSYPPGGKTK